MSRAVSPALGTVMLLAVTLVAVTAVGTVVLGTADPPAPASHLVLAVEADADSGRVTLVHEGGPEVDVREVEFRVSVDGEPLAHQPPVPFYSAPGFGSFPSGPFNPSADPRWELGERATLTVTGMNAASLSGGDRVRIDLYRDDLLLATAETTAR